MNVIDNLEELLAAASPGPWEAIGPMNKEHAKRLEEGSAFTCWVYSSADEVATFDAHELEQNFANARFVLLVHPLVQALVESQKALALGLCTCDYLQDTCPLHSEYIERQIKESWTDEKAIKRVTAARAAVRLDGLAKAMER